MQLHQKTALGVGSIPIILDMNYDVE